MRVILITGPSASGKTYIGNKISKNLDNSILIATDNYYKANILSKLLSNLISDYYDKPISFKYNKMKSDITKLIKGEKKIKSCKYNFKTKESYINIINNNYKNHIIIVEGIFSLEILNDFRDKVYITIVCSLDKKVCLERKIKRDINERNLKEANIIKTFNNAWDLFYSRYKYFLSEKNYINLNTYNENKTEEIIQSIKNEAL